MASDRQIHYSVLPSRHKIEGVISKLEEYLYDVQFEIMQECSHCGRCLVLFHYIV